MDTAKVSTSTLDIRRALLKIQIRLSIHPPIQVAGSHGTRHLYCHHYGLFKSCQFCRVDHRTRADIIQWTNALTQKAANSGSGIDVQFAIAKWVFVGCIIFSFLLVSPRPGDEIQETRGWRASWQADVQYGYEFYKAKLVIQSRDIAYGFTNLQANDYFSFSELTWTLCRQWNSPANACRKLRQLLSVLSYRIFNQTKGRFRILHLFHL